MNYESIGISAGMLAAFLWIAKLVGEKVVARFFEKMKNADELKDTMLHEKIARLEKASEKSRELFDQVRHDIVAHKILLQSFDKSFTEMKQDVRSSANKVYDVVSKHFEVSKIVNQKMNDVESRIKVQETNIQTFMHWLTSRNKGSDGK